MDNGEYKNQAGRILTVKDVPTHFMIIDKDFAYSINPFTTLQRHYDE